MLALIQFNAITLLVALLIGVATGWWAFGRRGSGSAETNNREAEDSNRT